MSMNNDVLKQCIVRLEYKSTTDTDKFEGSGSGAIVHLDKKDYFYIFTAKHTFFKDKIDNVDMNESEINLNNISIFDFKNQEIASKILHIIGIDKKYDFVILVVKNLTDNLSKMPSLAIYEDDFKDCKICGFPSSKKPDKNTSILFDCTYSMRDDVHDTYEVKSNTLLTIDGANLNANEEIVGLSGSGVFVESATGKLYLAGIQIQTASHNSLVCLDIRILAREINDALEDKNYLPIEIDGYALKDELGIDTSNIDFDDMLKKLKNRHFYDKFIAKEHKEIVIEFNGGQKQDLNKKSKELAEEYLAVSILFHKKGDNRRSTIYFKKAVENNPSYYALFLKAKDERKLTDKQKEKYNKINSEVLNSDISADNLFLEMLENKLKKLKDFDEKEGVYIQMIKLLETQLRELKSGQDFDGKKEFILKKSLELFELYLDEKKLDEADRLLFDLKEKKYSVDEFLYQLYTNQDFWENSSSSKQELSKKYLDLLDKFKDDEERFKKLKEQLDLIYDDKTDRVTSELNSVKKQINKYEEQIKSLEDMFSKYIKDEKVFNKVDEVNSQLRNSHIKLDNISDTIKNNHDILIQILLNGIIETNKNLIAGVQKIYKNSKINENLVQTLNSTITYMNQRVKNLSLHGDKQPDIKWVEEIIRECNSTLYTDIEKLYKDDTDSIKDDLFRKSLAVAEKRHQEHLVSLKISLTDKDREISNLSFQLKELTKWLDMINNEYETLKISSSEFEQKSLELTKMNQQLKDNISKSDTNTIDTLELMEYQNKVENLKKIIEKLKGKNEQLDELKKSISLSSSTADKSLEVLNSIEGIESNYKLNKEEYFNQIETFYAETKEKLEDKSDKVLVKHLNRIKKEISKIKEEGNLDNDVLFRLDSQLQQIQDYTPKKKGFWKKLENFFCFTDKIVLFVLYLVGTVILFVNIYKY